MNKDKKTTLAEIKQYIKSNLLTAQVKSKFGIKNMSKLSSEQKQQLQGWFEKQPKQMQKQVQQQRKISKSRRSSDESETQLFMPNLENAINEKISNSASQILKEGGIRAKGSIDSQEQLSDIINKSKKLSPSDQRIIIGAIKQDLSENQQLNLAQSHPRSYGKLRQMYSGFSQQQSQTDQSEYLPNNSSLGSYLGNQSVIFADHEWFKINKRRAKIYDLIKSHEKLNQESQLEHNKRLYKQLTRNGNMGGAELAVIENKHGIEEYHKRYPSIDQMLNTTVMDQFCQDMITRHHLTLTQADLFKTIVKSGQSTVIPNIQFLQDKYKDSGKDEDFKQYQQALIKSIGMQVAYNGAQDWSKLNLVNPTDNVAAPALSSGLNQPSFMPVKDVLKQISNMADYISKLSGDLNHVDLKWYQDQNNLFTNIIVKKKEQTNFIPTVGQAFKLRQLTC